MTPARQPLLVCFAVVAYCAWQSRDLLGAWRSSPLERFGWVALVLWLVPLAVVQTRRSGITKAPNGNSILLWTGLGFTFFGTLGAVNALHYAGLACALAGFVPWSWKIFPWLLSAISWMPAFGYLISQQFPKLVLPARLTLAALVAGWTTWAIFRRTKSVS